MEFLERQREPGRPPISPRGLVLPVLLVLDVAGQSQSAAAVLRGFATHQRAYEASCQKLFDALDAMEERLSKSRYLFGKRIVETDWRLFCTLIRFDFVYHGHFKCNLRRIIDYPNLQGYLLDLYQQPGIAETVSIDHIKRHYYMTHEEINPTRIVPLGPIIDLTKPHGRERI